MSKVILVFFSLILVACGNRDLDTYKYVIKRTDRMVVANVDLTDSFVLDSLSRLEHLQDIFTRSIKPIDADTVIPDQLILLYAKGRQIGKLSDFNGAKLILGFYTDSFLFSFNKW